jgi:signal transduction histidine kinase
MFKWVLSKKWLPEVIFGGFATIIFGSIDFALQGTGGLIASIIFSTAYFFVRQYGFVGWLLLLVATFTELALHIQPVIAGFAVVAAVLLSGIFATRRSGLTYLASSLVSGLTMVWQVSFNTRLLTDIYGVNIYNENGRWFAFGFAAITVIGINGFIWLLGSYIAESIVKRRVSRERDSFENVNLRALLDLAEQNERFAIARDLNELIMQRVSAMLTLTDGARFASKLDQEVAGRTLERLVTLIRGVHEEMRRMFDMLNKSVAVAATPPSIQDISGLLTQFRELGYSAKMTQIGKPIPLIASAELNIYRIVFEALQNIKEHAPLGSAIEVEFIWSENGLQVLVKDNGTEITAKQDANILLEQEGYTAEDDVFALTQQVTGASITGMRERAQLFQGSIDARRVPGIGFTLSAIFPGIDEYKVSEED